MKIDTLRTKLIKFIKITVSLQPLHLNYLTEDLSREVNMNTSWTRV